MGLNAESVYGPEPDNAGPEGPGFAGSALGCSNSNNGRKPLAPWMSQRKACRGKKKAKKNKKHAPKRNAPEGAPEAETESPSSEAESVRQSATCSPCPGPAPPGGSVRTRTGCTGSEGGRGPGLGCPREVRQALSEARHVILNTSNTTRRNWRHLNPVLQTPFLWELPALAQDKTRLYEKLDHFLYGAIPWVTAANRVRLAADFCRMREVWKSRELLQEAYLLVDADGEVMSTYWPALKHVLDSSWLLVRSDSEAQRGSPFPDGTAESDFVPYSGLGKRQQAAVHAMRALMARDLKAAKSARRKDGEEGLWLLVQGLCLETVGRGHFARSGSPGSGSESDQSSLALFERAYALRKNPLTAMVLAESLLQDGSPGSSRRCAELVRASLEEFPLSPHLLLRSAQLLERLPPPHQDLRRAEACYLSAVQAGRDWKRADLLFGKFLMKHGDTRLAEEHLERASSVYQEVRPRRVIRLDILFFFGRCRFD